MEIESHYAQTDKSLSFFSFFFFKEINTFIQQEHKNIDPIWKLRLLHY